MSYEQEDTCHMSRRIHVIRGGGYMSYEEEDRLCRAEALYMCVYVCICMYHVYIYVCMYIHITS